MTIPAGTALGDRYTIVDVIGRGGMAEVYRADDRVLERQVAVKVLRSTSAGVAERARFAGEARTLASLNHPGLVTVLDAGIEDEHPYLVMELVEGQTLSARIQERGPLDPVQVAALGSQLGGALAHAHASGVVHRDVKPSNILVRSDDSVVLTDFGIARLVDGAEEHTRTGETIGSPAYLSPEQITGEPPTTAVDIYSLGLVLVEALTGRRAYSGTPIEAAVARLKADPVIPVSLERELRDLLVRMTRREPADRPTSSEVEAALTVDVQVRPAADLTGAAAAETGAYVMASDTLVMLPPDQVSSETDSRRRRAGLLGAAALVATAAIALGGALAFDHGGVASSPSPNPTSAPTKTPSPVVSDPTLAANVRTVSPVKNPTQVTHPKSAGRAKGRKGRGHK